MLAAINRLLDWIKSLFWKEEMELTLVGLQNSGKTTFVNVIAVSCYSFSSSHRALMKAILSTTEWTVRGGHDPDRGIQHEKGDERKCHD